MQYEELQQIWDTQRQRPVFSANDFVLHMELYRARERIRRRQFWGGVFPLFVLSLPMLTLLAVPIVQFFAQGAIERIPSDELPMTASDVLACLVGMALVSFAALSMYVNRRKNEKVQSLFAPSLRQEIELGIALIESEMSRIRSGVGWIVLAAFLLANAIAGWEVGRLNDNPSPWSSLGITTPMLTWMLLLLARRRGMQERLQRKRALEALRANLDENPAESEDFRA